MNLTSGIGMQYNLVVFNEEIIGRPLSAFTEKVVGTQHRYYESHYARLVINTLIHELSKEELLKLIISYSAFNLLHLCAK